MSAEPQGDPRELAVLTRANHDMRSPLSVILGVFELLQETESLSQSERRYVQLGMKAAEDLLGLADTLRLYASLQKNIVALDCVRIDLMEIARGHLEAGLSGKRATVRALPSEPDTLAMGDPDYLKLALTHLARHVAAYLPDGEAAPTVTLRQHVDDGGAVTLLIAAHHSSGDANVGDGDGEEVLSEDIGTLNAVRLIEVMGGTVSLKTAGHLLTVTLPAAG